MIPLRVRIWHSILCKLELHEWRYSTLILKHGFRSGNRCVHCRIWSNDSVPAPVHDEQSHD